MYWGTLTSDDRDYSQHASSVCVHSAARDVIVRTNAPERKPAACPPEPFALKTSQPTFASIGLELKPAQSSAAYSETQVHATTFAVLFAVSFCHLLNDMMQSLMSAIYPQLKESLELNFAQVGLISATYQLTASMLQPLQP